MVGDVGAAGLGDGASREARPGTRCRVGGAFPPPREARPQGVSSGPFPAGNPCMLFAGKDEHVRPEPQRRTLPQERRGGAETARPRTPGARRRSPCRGRRAPACCARLRKWASSARRCAPAPWLLKRRAEEGRLPGSQMGHDLVSIHVLLWKPFLRLQPFRRHGGDGWAFGVSPQRCSE